MKNIKAIKRVVLVLILSLMVTSAWSQQCGIFVEIYESGDPLNPGTPTTQEICNYDTGGPAVCFESVPNTSGYFMYYEEGCDTWLPATPLTGATFFLVFLLGIYGIYIYRKRLVVK